MVRSLFEEVLQDQRRGKEGSVASHVIGYSDGFDNLLPCGSEFDGPLTQGCGTLHGSVLYADATAISSLTF